MILYTLLNFFFKYLWEFNTFFQNALFEIINHFDFKLIVIYCYFLAAKERVNWNFVKHPLLLNITSCYEIINYYNN